MILHSLHNPPIIEPQPGKKEPQHTVCGLPLARFIPLPVSHFSRPDYRLDLIIDMCATGFASVLM
jgi:hypothetical protein